MLKRTIIGYGHVRLVINLIHTGQTGVHKAVMKATELGDGKLRCKTYY